jgi:hypothetical protein
MLQRTPTFTEVISQVDLVVALQFREQIIQLACS